MTTIAQQPEGRVIGGVDTHKDIHVAVVIDELGRSPVGAWPVAVCRRVEPGRDDRASGDLEGTAAGSPSSDGGRGHSGADPVVDPVRHGSQDSDDTAPPRGSI